MTNCTQANCTKANRTQPSGTKASTALAAFAFAAGLAFASAVHAQDTAQSNEGVGTPMQAGQAARWVVAADATPLRSGPMDRFYPTLELTSDRPLEVVGEQDGWLRVRVPAGSRAFVKAGNAEQAGDSAVVLTTPSRLRAAHLTGGIAASWRSLLETPLPAGTELPLLETITSGNRTVGYAVAAPASSTGFVAAGSVRTVAGDELAQLRQTLPDGVLAAGQPRQPDADQTANPSGAQQPDTGASADSASDPSNDLDTSLLAPMVVPETASGTPAQSTDNTPAETPVDSTVEAPATSPAEPEADAPTEASEPGSTGSQVRQPNPTLPGEPVVETERPLVSDADADRIIEEARATSTESSSDDSEAIERQTGAAAAQPVARAVLTLDELDAAYERMKTLPIEEAELEELRSEYQRAIDATPRDAFSERLLQQLRNRVAFIDARIRVKELKLTRARETQAIPQDLITLRSRIETIRASGRFDVVGELTPSTLYDGGKLPRLIAVRSRDGYGRTVGYLSPTPDVIERLGQIVGIEGSAAMDGELGVRLITPRRIEAFRRD